MPFADRESLSTRFPATSSKGAPMTIGQTTDDTLRLTREALANPGDPLAKNVTIATGLSNYDLQAPAKNLYPTITPLRNALPRVQRLNPGDAARWRTISSITGSGFDAMGWVPEGQRSASMSYAANPGRALCDARRGRHGDLRSRGRRAGLRGHQLDRDAAPAAEDDAQGGDRAARRQRLARAGHARRRRRSQRLGHAARRCRPATYSVIVVALDLRGLPQFVAEPRASRRPRRSPATTAIPTRSTAAPRTAAPTRPRR